MTVMRATRRLKTFAAATTVLALAGCTADRAPDAITLAEWRRDPASAELRRLLEAGDVDQRVRAARAMGRIQGNGYWNELLAALDDAERDVVDEVLFAIGGLGLARGASVPPAAVEAVAARVGDEVAGTAALAVEALGKLATAEVPGLVVPALGHPSPAVRAEAATALLRCRFVPTWRGDADDPPPLPPDAVDALIAALSDEDASVRWNAAHAFSRYGQPEALPAVAALDGDPNAWVRMFAVRTVGRSGDAAAADSVVWGLEDDSLHVRAETVAGFGALGRHELLPPALDGDPSFHVRTALARALGTSPAADAVARLRALAGDRSPSVRAAALAALSRRLGAPFAATLEEHLRAEDWRTRAAAAAAAGALDSAGLPLLAAAAVDTDERVRIAALSALGGLGDDGRPPILDALAAEGLAERGTAVALLSSAEFPDKLERMREVYERSPGDAWVEVRETVVGALAELDGAVALLTRMAIDDPAYSVRSAAALALAAREEPAPRPGAPPSELPRGADSIAGGRPTVVLETSKGVLEIECFADEAPLHVANWVRLVREGFYDGLSWHRVVPNFVIQGGDPTGTGWGGPGYLLPDEINRERYLPGTVGMPKAGKDTGGCQIFVTHVPTPHLDGNYTVFGRVTAGLDVVDEIEVGDTIVRATVR